MTHAIAHSLNICTLATWLSVTGFGVVAVVVSPWHPSPGLPNVAETMVIPEDFTIGAEEESSGGDAAAETTPALPEEFQQSPPELAPMTDFQPLPAVPDLPSRPTASAQESPPPRPVVASSGLTSSRRSASNSTAGSSGPSKPASGSGETSGMSSASRLAAGRMPAPSYPAECRRKGQTGTVLVEFTVDAAGRVISAYAKSPSSWPLLNEEAVRTVRRWTFPPGGVMKLQRPIVFKLR